jgi:hypothetical protein
MSRSRRVRQGFSWPAFFASIPLLAAAYDAYEVANRSSEPHDFIWVRAYFIVLGPRLALALIIALAVYGSASALRALLHRLQGASDAAQAARSQIAVPRPQWAIKS